MAADLAKVTVTWTGEPGSPYFSTFWFGYGGIGDGTPAQDVTSVSVFLTAIKGNICAALSYTTGSEVELIDGSTGEIQSVAAVTAAGGTCTGGANPLPFGTAGRVVWSTGVFIGGRQVKGRFFMPAPDENDNGAGVPIGGIQATVNAAAATLIGDANTTFSVYSPTHRAHAVVISGVMSTQWSRLRSRRD